MKMDKRLKSGILPHWWRPLEPHLCTVEQTKETVKCKL
uniref:Uncharacterized protein n=2 Tax=Anguilla anguilla TaxID=7936 RepID=A0A0E9R940_ANGAN